MVSIVEPGLRVKLVRRVPRCIGETLDLRSELTTNGIDLEVGRGNYRKLLANFWRTLATLGLMTIWQYMLAELFW